MVINVMLKRNTPALTFFYLPQNMLRAWRASSPARRPASQPPPPHRAASTAMCCRLRQPLSRPYRRGRGRAIGSSDSNTTCFCPSALPGPPAMLYSPARQKQHATRSGLGCRGGIGGFTSKGQELQGDVPSLRSVPVERSEPGVSGGDRPETTGGRRVVGRRLTP